MALGKGRSPWIMDSHQVEGVVTYLHHGARVGDLAAGGSGLEGGVAQAATTSYQDEQRSVHGWVCTAPKGPPAQSCGMGGSLERRAW
jgi:hypothetical protein